MKILGKIFAKEKVDKKNLYRIVGMLALGILLMITSNLLAPSKKETKQTSHDIGLTKNLENESKKEGNISYEINMENRLKGILKKMQGVGEVEVMITTTYGREIILAEDITTNESDSLEKDEEGGIREVKNYEDKKQIVMKTGGMSSGNEPVVLKEKEPKVQGVLIISEGANNSLVKESIIEAAKTLLDIPAHRVSVYKLEK